MKDDHECPPPNERGFRAGPPEDRLVCPVCGDPGYEPCPDAVVQGWLAVDYWMPGVIAESFTTGLPGDCDSLPLLVGQPAWPAVLAAARAHDGTGCDPVECDACVSQRSVMQVNCWYWRGVETRTAT